MTVALLTTDEASAFLAVPLRTMEDWRRRRCGPSFIRLPHGVRYRREDLDAWIEAHRVKTAGGAA